MMNGAGEKPMADEADQDQETIAQAEALALKLRSVVAQTPAYKQWQAAEQLVRTLKGDTVAVSPMMLAEWTPMLTTNFERWLRDSVAHSIKPPTGHRYYGGGIVVPNKPKKLSQADAAEIALKKAQKPLTTAEVVAAIQEEGAHVGGADPLVNVSSTLSKDERFVSHRWGSASVWWLVGEPIPASAELHQRILELGLESEQAGCDTPAAEEPI